MLLLTGLFFTGCKEPELGLEIQNPGDAINLLSYSGMAVHTSLEKEDSVKTDELSANLLGTYHDPLLGMVRASFFAQLRLGASNINLGTGYALDSMVLALPYRGHYGDISESQGRQNFKVYRVTEDFSREAEYYSNDSVRVGDLLGETGFIAPNPKDSVMIGGKRQAPQLRIRLNPSVASILLEELRTNGALSTSDAFLLSFKGIYVASELADNSPGYGAILDFNLLAGARLEMHYHNVDTNNLVANFVINDQSARFNRFRRTYSQDVNDLLATHALEYSYTATMAGLRTRVDFPNLHTWRNGRKILLNKASLIVPVDTDFVGKYPVSPVLNLITKSSSGSLIQTLDLLVGGEYPGGTYNASRREYVFTITRHLQGLLNENVADNGLFIQPVGTGVSSYRTRINAGMHPERPIRLELLYQELH